MARGTVKWFSDQKGYGFIAAEDNDEVFVHHSAIEGNGFRTLHEGELVEYDVKQSDKGNEASRVIRVI
jgi:CspA family cold shock protein